MKGAIGLSQKAMMRGRDWLTNTKREPTDDRPHVRKRPRMSLYGKATVEEIRADYAKYADCLTAKKNMYLANIDEPHSLINFIYLDSYEGQQLPCTAWCDSVSISIITLCMSVLRAASSFASFKHLLCVRWRRRQSVIINTRLRSSLSL